MPHYHNYLNVLSQANRKAIMPGESVLVSKHVASQIFTHVNSFAHALAHTIARRYVLELASDLGHHKWITCVVAMRAQRITHSRLLTGTATQRDAHLAVRREILTSPDSTLTALGIGRAAIILFLEIHFPSFRLITLSFLSVSLHFTSLLSSALLFPRFCFSFLSLSLFIFTSLLPYHSFSFLPSFLFHFIL